MPALIAAILLLQSGGTDSSEPPTVTAVRVDRAPVVDGQLDDPGWNLAPAVTDFRQTDPDEGAPVSEATAVRVLYDGTAVYVGARLFDSAPARIVRRLARRDASTHSDEFRVFLDSYHDRRTAFQFIVNAAFVVWTQSRSDYWPHDASFDLNRDFQRELFLDRPTNVRLVKFNYWLSL